MFGPYQRKPTPKGKQQNPYSRNTPLFVAPNVALPVARVASHKDKKDDAEQNTDIVKDVYLSESFDQCKDPHNLLQRRKRNNVDNKKDVWNSCKDLEIDG